MVLSEEEYRFIVGHIAEVKIGELEDWINGQEPSIILNHKMSFIDSFSEDDIRHAIMFYLLTNS